jgi:phenylacetate-CoA ligase
MMQQVLKKWVSLQRSQWANRGSLLERQNIGLRNVVYYAYHKVPFYRKLYETAGVNPESVTRVKAIGQLPLINKEQFRAVSLKERTASGIDLRTCRPHTTSGSTGVTIQLLEDPVSFAYRDALNLRFLWAYGVRPLDKIVRLRFSQVTGSAQPNIRLADRRGLWAYAKAKFTKQLTYDMDLAEHLRLLSIWKADVLMAATPYCKALARLTESMGKPLSFKVVVTSAVTLDKSTREFISDKFGAEVYDHYGIEEVGGSIAWECPTHSGYHINAETLLLEFLRNGRPVQAGEPGEVHVTSFHRIATPIIRYFDGDLATPIDDECPCGRGLPMIREIQGRVVDFITTEEGRHISPISIIAALQNTPGLDQFKVTQREDYKIEVLFTTRTKEGTDSVVQEVQRRCLLLFREDPFNVSLVSKIEKSEDRKFRAVESLLR